MLSQKRQEPERFIRGERDFPVTNDFFPVMLFVFPVMNCCLFEDSHGGHSVRMLHGT